MRDDDNKTYERKLKVTKCVTYEITYNFTRTVCQEKLFVYESYDKITITIPKYISLF